VNGRHSSFDESIQVVANVGDIARFADRNRFASWTGTAPIDASSGANNRHRLSRAGNRRMNHMLHIVAVTQISPLSIPDPPTPIAREEAHPCLTSRPGEPDAVA